MISRNSTASEIVEHLKRYRLQKCIDRLRRNGVDSGYALGVPKKALQETAKLLRKNQQLAAELWDTSFHESQLIAILIADPAEMPFELQKNWLHAIRSWDLCDHFSRYLLPYLYQYQRLISYSANQSEVYVRRSAFAGIACSLIHRNDITEDQIEGYLQTITVGATDTRHHVRKAVAWALVEIGKCNTDHQEQAIIHASELMLGDKAQQWVARNALKELEILIKVPERIRLISTKSKTGRMHSAGRQSS